MYYQDHSELNHYALYITGPTPPPTQENDAPDATTVVFKKYTHKRLSWGVNK